MACVDQKRQLEGELRGHFVAQPSHFDDHDRRLAAELEPGAQVAPRIAAGIDECPLADRPHGQDAVALDSVIGEVDCGFGVDGEVAVGIGRRPGAVGVEIGDHGDDRSRAGGLVADDRQSRSGGRIEGDRDIRRVGLDLAHQAAFGKLTGQGAQNAVDQTIGIARAGPAHIDRSNLQLGGFEGGEDGRDRSFGGSGAGDQ